MAATQTAADRQQDYVHWPKTLLRVGFGVIWLIDAILKWLPGFRSDYMSVIMGEADGQPGWTKPWFDFWTNLQHPAATFFAYLVAVAETLIALALIFGFARKLTYIAATVLSLLIWGTAEGFGGPYSTGASDIGTAIIYALVFAALLMFSYYQGPAPFSVDAWLERRISRWHWVAEVGHHHDHDSASQPTDAATSQPTPSPSGATTDSSAVTVA
jgi:nitrite reductase (NO-forming)